MAKPFLDWDGGAVWMVIKSTALPVFTVALFLFSVWKAVMGLRAGRAPENASIAFILIAVVLQQWSRSKDDGSGIRVLRAVRWVSVFMAAALLILSATRH